MRANSFIVRAYLVRGAVVWVGARLMISAVLFLAGVNPGRVGIGVSVAIIAIAVALGFVETRRQRERVLLANLGVSLSSLATLPGAPAIAGELLVNVAWPSSR